MKISVITDCFKSNLETAIHTASQLGVSGVQIYATTGEFSPQTLTQERRSFYKRLLRENGLEISALCGDLGGHGFEIEEDNSDRIKVTKEIIDFACDMGVKIITTHIGVIPQEKENPRYGVMLAALTECGLYAKQRGVTLAIETGPETAKTLKAFIDDTKCGVGVNLDPANFVMVTGQDPVQAVYLLRDLIVHTHVKDGIMLKKTDPKIIYDCFADGGIDALNVSDYFKETPIGEGDVDFKAYFEALREIGYQGYYTIEREAGPNPAEDIAAAVRFLKNNL